VTQDGPRAEQHVGVPRQLDTGSAADASTTPAAGPTGIHWADAAVPAWQDLPLDPSAHVEYSLRGFTELRCHGVSGPLPGSVLQFPEEMVTKVNGNAYSGFWRRWRLGGTSQDNRSQHIEAFCWGGLTSHASVQALWVLLLPFSLVNLAHWMVLPYVNKAGRVVAGISVVLLRVLALSYTALLLLAGAEVTLDVGGWQCGARRACRPKLLPFGLASAEGKSPGWHLATGALVLALVLLLLWRAGLARYRPLRQAHATPHPTVPWHRPEGAEPVLGMPNFWSVDLSTRWLRGLHGLVWCAGLGAILCGVLGSVARHGSAGSTVGHLLLIVNLAVLGAVVVLTLFPTRFGRGGAHIGSTRGLTAMIWAGLVLLAGSIAATVVLMPVGADAGGHRMPWLQGALGRLVFFQVVLFVLLACCTAWLAAAWWRHKDPVPGYQPMLRGALALMLAMLGWLLGLTFSAGIGLIAAHRFGVAVTTLQPHVARKTLQVLVPPLYQWVEAAVVAVTVLLVAGLVAIGIWVLARTRRAAAEVASQPRERTAGGSQDYREHARSAGRIRVLAQSVEAVPWILAGTVAAAAGLSALALARYLATSGSMHTWFPESGWLSSLPTAGTWLATAGTAGLLGLGYAAYRNQGTRRVVGILWDVTTFWPRANHPMTPACTAERSVPQLARRIGDLTAEPGDAVVLSGHSQGSILSAAAVLRLSYGSQADQLARLAMLTYGSPLRRLYARCFPAYFPRAVLEQVRRDLGGRWLNLWCWTDPIGGTVGPKLPVTPAEELSASDVQMTPDPLTLGADPRTGLPAVVCDHTGYINRPEFDTAVRLLRDSVGAAVQAGPPDSA
jgi:hypothetical protein